LVAGFCSGVEHPAGVVLAIAEQVTGTSPIVDHLISHFVLIYVHGMHATGCGDRSTVEDGVQFISLAQPGGSAATMGLVLLARSADWQRFAVNHRNQSRLVGGRYWGGSDVASAVGQG
jgi:hypothetical protein